MTEQITFARSPADTPRNVQLQADREMFAGATRSSQLQLLEAQRSASMHLLQFHLPSPRPPGRNIASSWLSKFSNLDRANTSLERVGAWWPSSSYPWANKKSPCAGFCAETRASGSHLVHDRWTSLVSERHVSASNSMMDDCSLSLRQQS